MRIAADFDGTIIKDEYPEITELLPNAKKVLSYWHSRGHKIIINTCRANHYAENAKAYLIQKGIKYDYFNENDPCLIQKYNTDCRKISSDIYIDDKNISDIVLRKRLGIEAYNEELWQMHLEEFQFIEKPCIICIVGESGAGKTLAAEYLESMYDINLIQSYTDRDKRYPEELGHTFLSQLEFDRIMEGSEILAYTKFGNNRYCCITEDLAHCNSYVIDEYGLEMLKANWSDVYDIYSVRITRPLFDRVECVGEERTNRDVGRFNLLPEEFDYVINNDDSNKEDLYKKLEDFMKLFRLEERAKQYDTNII